MRSKNTSGIHNVLIVDRRWIFEYYLIVSRRRCNGDRRPQVFLCVGLKRHVEYKAFGLTLIFAQVRSQTQTQNKVGWRAFCFLHIVHMPNGRLLHEVYRNNNDCTLICGWSIRMQMKQKRIRKRNTKENAHKENRKRGPSHTTARGRHPGNVQRRRVEGIDMEIPCPLNSAPCETGEGTTSYIICLQSSSRRMETDLILTK